jgi:hypothetical protein
MKSHRAVEAFRIALGLGSHNEGRDLSIVLCGRAAHLLSEDPGNVIDAEILEKHLPVFIEWSTPFIIGPNAENPPHWLPDCIIKPSTAADIAAMMRDADRVLVF